MRLALALAVLLAALLAAAPARAGILVPEDETELAQLLAEAQAEQGVCYGWNVANNFAPSADVGSSTGGPRVPLDVSQCPKFVLLEGDIEYTCDSCEAEDSARLRITSNLARPPTMDQLERYGYDAGDLTGDVDDIALFNIANAMPLAVAENGEAPFVPYETPEAPVPASDVPTGGGGSDFWRDAWSGLLVFAFLILAGIVIFLYQRGQRPAGRPERT